MVVMIKYLTIFIILLSASAFGKTTGNELFYKCVKTETFMSQTEGIADTDIVSCLERVAGFKDATLLAQAVYNPNRSIKEGICFPDGANTIQLVSVLVKYLKENPSTRHQEAYIEMYSAFLSAYPCGYK